MKLSSRNIHIFVFSIQKICSLKNRQLFIAGHIPAEYFNWRAISYFRSHLSVISWSQSDVPFIKRKKERKKEKVIKGFGFGLMKQNLADVCYMPPDDQSKFSNELMKIEP